MDSISDEQLIDEDLYESLLNALLERLKDIKSRVQVQAIKASYKFQNLKNYKVRITLTSNAN